MAQEKIGFRNRLEFLLLSDDAARWKAMAWIIFLIGVAGSLDLAVMNSPVDDAVLLMGTLTLILSIGWIGWYCTFRPRQNTQLQSTSRRRLGLQAAASTVAFLVGVTLWRSEARALSSDLLQAVKTNDYGKAANVFERARTVAVHLDRSLTTTASLRLLNVTDRPEAWDAVMASLGYKSFSDARILPADLRGQPSQFTTKYVTANAIGGRTPDRVGVTGVAPAKQAARLNLIGRNENADKAYGNKFIFVYGGDLVIDNMDMKNVVFRNSHIIYQGDPIKMENVYFINCRFDIALTAAGKAFATALLTSNPVNLTISS
jgi:hypothetical protein